MRYLKVIFMGVIIMVSLQFGCQNKKVSINRTDLQNIFKGKTVEYFISSTLEKYKQYNFIDEPPFKLKAIEFLYSDNKRVHIFLDTLKYEQSFDTLRNWNLEKVKKEKIISIMILK